MKFLYYMALLAGIATAASCSDEKEEMNGGYEELTDFEVGPEGGVRQVRIPVSGAWTASANEPWLMISPASGDGPTVCRIKADSTILAGETRSAALRITAQGTHEQRTAVVTQRGFARNLTVSKPEVSVESYGAFGKRFFDVDITSNVAFAIEIVPTDTEGGENAPTGNAPWLTYDKYDFNLDRGARPRTARIRFKWDSNTDPETRGAEIRFRTDDDEAMERLDKIVVRQDQAPEITDDRKGDSLALVTIQRKLGSTEWDYSESMLYWSGVKLWEEGAEGTNEENIGRVRSVQFSFFTWREAASLPEEIRHLKYAESISFFSNTNKAQLSLDPGTAITELTNLKELQLFAIGLSSLPAAFENLKNLEYLDLSGNNFQEVPEVLAPEKLPALRHLLLNDNCRRHDGDLSIATAPIEKWGGLYADGTFPKRLLQWDSLRTLRISANLIHGTIPDMKDYPKVYTPADIKQDTLPSILQRKPKVLPKCTMFSINLNYLTGSLPDWILYHPYLMNWSPSILIFNQEIYPDKNGTLPGFDNVPVSPDYWYELYPHKKPEN